VSTVVEAGTGSRVGRFELRRVLGKGAQATVWLALDTRLDREVALKLFAPGADRAAVHRWLDEARAASRLAHPNLVPVFEADELDGQGALVFEFVDGQTLAQQIRRRGAQPPDEAVRLMAGVLDALMIAHQAGIVHRDLKPSNILVGSDGRPRVMDFGIAARVEARGDGRDRGRIVGAPGYLSPEAAHGEPPDPAMDVFAAGMVLAELLCGHPLVRERDPWVALRRVQQEEFLLPPAAPVDDALRAIVNRALARDRAARYGDAGRMRQALAEWARPAAVASEAGPGGGGGTLEFLLRRMKRRTDFPALSAAVTRIQRIANSERDSLHTLAEEILRDVALTNRLLRIVNSAHYAQGGAGGVSTVSRAVALVGFAGIRNMALSILLLDHLQDKAHAKVLQDDFLRALMAGQLASELTPPGCGAEEAFIVAMLRNLGRLLVGFYLPEEAQQIRALSAERGASEEVAAARVLGIGYEDLGIGVGRHWGLPHALLAGMSRPAGESPARFLASGVERLRWTATAANEVALALLSGEGEAAWMEAIAARHGRALGITLEQLKEAVGRSRERLGHLATALQLDLARDSPARRLLKLDGSACAADPDAMAAIGLQATAAAPPAAVASAGSGDGRPDEQAALMLSAGIQDITQSMVDEQFDLNDVLRMVLETMMRALGFRRVILMLRDPRAEALVGRFGLGEGAAELVPCCRVALRPAPGVSPDLFAAVCARGADTLISDAGVESIASRLPAWHARRFDARSFVLLPMALKGAVFGLIYADKAEAGAIRLDEKGLNLLRTLRNQAVMAFRQKG
jgi:serine/threonine protein kinase